MNGIKDIKFIHLHVHSEYSLLDGSAKISELVSRTKELGMDSIALTDHGVMFGVIDFYKESVVQGIKPIIGCEVYVAKTSRFDKNSNSENYYYHLVLLAENNEGYHNLIKLVSCGFKEGFYYKPRIDVDVLRRYSSGLIALSACLSGPVAKTILDSSYEKARDIAVLYNEIFGKDNFYLELQDHGLSEQKIVNQSLINISRETSIPLVCTNDLHYIDSQDAKAHEILLCIQTGKTVDDPDHMVYEGEQFYLKSPEEMYSLFSYVPQALENTVRIAERCNVEIKFHEYKLPKFDLPPDKTPFQFLRELCLNGLKKRYNSVSNELSARLNHELEIIKSMGFIDYFLIVWDVVNFAHENGIIVGPGRGSAVGSIVIYALGITNVDPIKYNLQFERFLNPERISMPDIDIDFCYERRQEVIDYATHKYGVENVAQIITFGTMSAKSAIRDVGRALAMPYSEVDKIAKMIPLTLGITIAAALNINFDLFKLYKENRDVAYLIDMAKKLEGLPRHSSTHATGVVICDSPIDEYVPLNRNGDVITTQFSMNTLEELGLLKIDFLGLRTLTVIQKTITEIKRRHNIDIDIDKINYEDNCVYEMISQAKTEGVFQLESSGMKSFMKELRPLSIEDVTAGVALYRPGPMDFIPKYLNGKNSNGNINYTHPSLEPILKNTYGCIIYQEQVTQIVRDLAGFSYAQSDIIRRAMSKKKADVMQKERENFIHGHGADVPGCIKKGIPKETAEKIWDEMTDFAKYAFNKSHAAAYAVVVYQTAWLKYYYPLEYMASLMSSVMDWTSKVAEYVNECKKLGIAVFPPDINYGFGDFTANKDGILFGLNAIKNVGRPTIAAIVAEREKNGSFSSLTEFINRIEQKDLNKRCIESLIKAGAFDSLKGKRSQYTAVYEKIINGLGQTRKNSVSGQMSLFDVMVNSDSSAIYKDELPDIAEFSAKKLLSDEKEVLGIYVTGHPAMEYEKIFSKHVTAKSSDFIVESSESNNEFSGNDLKDGDEAVVGGIISAKSIKYTKNNDAMAFITIEDFYGEVELIVFPNVYNKYTYDILAGTPIIASGRISLKEGENAKLICNDLSFPSTEKSAEIVPAKELWIKIPKDVSVPYNDIISILYSFKGLTPVIVYDENSGKKRKVSESYWTDSENVLLISRLKQLLGEKSVVIQPSKAKNMR